VTREREREMNWTWFHRKGIDEEVDRTRGSKTLIDWCSIASALSQI